MERKKSGSELRAAARERMRKFRKLKKVEAEDRDANRSTESFQKVLGPVKEYDLDHEET